MVTGKDLADLAATRLGERYVNVLVPKNNPNWRGPWDCAEFASWVVYQKTRTLFGCVDNAGDPATVESYSGAWVRDAERGVLLPATEEDAYTQAGVFLLRRPPAPGRMGHVAISDGEGKVIEAAGVGLGVRRYGFAGRLWHFYVRIPDVRYSATGAVPAVRKPVPFLLQLETPWTRSPLVGKVQQALKDAGFDPGPIDGEFGPNTVAAVFAFQKTHRLVADGIVGPATARRLGVEWPV
jgi:N-acetylmuramoyl-L-alanine amidase